MSNLILRDLFIAPTFKSVGALDVRYYDVQIPKGKHLSAHLNFAGLKRVTFAANRHPAYSPARDIRYPQEREVPVGASYVQIGRVKLLEHFFLIKGKLYKHT